MTIRVAGTQDDVFFTAVVNERIFIVADRVSTGKKNIRIHCRGTRPIAIGKMRMLRRACPQTRARRVKSVIIIPKTEVE